MVFQNDSSSRSSKITEVSHVISIEVPDEEIVDRITEGFLANCVWFSTINSIHFLQMDVQVENSKKREELMILAYRSF